MRKRSMPSIKSNHLSKKEVQKSVRILSSYPLKFQMHSASTNLIRQSKTLMKSLKSRWAVTTKNLLRRSLQNSPTASIKANLHMTWYWMTIHLWKGIIQRRRSQTSFRIPRRRPLREHSLKLELSRSWRFPLQQRCQWISKETRRSGSRRM